MDRLDRFLDAYLQTGVIPAEATPAERDELEQLASSARMLRTAAVRIGSEAQGSMPGARARFERHMVAARTAPGPAPAVVRAAERRGFLGLSFLTLPRFAGLAVALALLVIIAGLGGSRLRSGPATVEALEPGDYVEVPGVVTDAREEGGARILTVSSPLGEIDVEANEATSVLDRESPAAADTLRPGAQVLVSGTVLDSRRVAAQAVAIGESAVPLGKRPALKRLKDVEAGLTGHVVTIALVPASGVARVVLEVPGGRLYLVMVDARSAQTLLEQTRALGVNVTVSREPGAPAGIFTLALASPPGQGSASPAPSAAAQTSALARVEGIITAVDGRTLTIRTLDGSQLVVVRPDTRILPGESGLAPGQLLAADAVGHLVVARGGIDDRTGALIAGVVVLGRRLERAPQSR